MSKPTVDRMLAGFKSFKAIYYDQRPERVEDLVGKRARIMWVSTFHSACVRILRKESHLLGYKSNFSIYDAQDQKRLMGLVIKDLELGAIKHEHQPGTTFRVFLDPAGHPFCLCSQ